MALPHGNAQEFEQRVNDFMEWIHGAHRHVRLEAVKAVVGACRLDEMTAIKGFASHTVRRKHRQDNHGENFKALPVFVLPPNIRIQFFGDDNDGVELQGDPILEENDVGGLNEAAGDGQVGIPDMGNHGQQHELDVGENDAWWFEGLSDVDKEYHEMFNVEEDGVSDYNEEMVNVEGGDPLHPLPLQPQQRVIVSVGQSFGEFFWYMIIAVLGFFRIRRFIQQHN